MRCLPMLAGVVVLGAVTGCASSRPTGVNFHSASHHYTVKQVETAFAAEGIQLHKATNQPVSGFVVPQRGHKPHLVATLVKVSANTEFILVKKPSGNHRMQRDGNVTVSFDPSNAQSVEAALARLH